MDEFAKIEASVASHKGNALQGNRDKFYLNGQYMDLHQRKDSTIKSTKHSFQQSVYAIARGSIEGELGEKAAFYAIDALSRYHLDIEENPELTLKEKMKLLESHLEKGLGKFNKMNEEFTTPEENNEVPLGARMIGMIIDRDNLLGFTLGYRGLFIQRNDEIHEISFKDPKGFYSTEFPVKEVLCFSETFQLEQNDVFFLATDKAYQPTQENVFKEIFKEHSLKEAVKEGVREALLYEGHDNITLLCVKVMEVVNEAKDSSKATEVIIPSVVKEEEIEGNHRNRDEEQDHLEKEEFLQKDRRSESKTFIHDTIAPHPTKNGHEKTVEDLNELLSREDEIERTEEELEREQILEERFKESQLLFSKFQGNNGQNHSFNTSTPVNKKNKLFKKMNLPKLNRNKLIAMIILFLSLILVVAALPTFRGLRERLSETEQETAINDNIGQAEEDLIGGDNNDLDDEESDNDDVDENPDSTSGEDYDDIEDEGTDEEETLEDPPAEDSQVHIVQEGDTLYAIAMRYYNDSSMVQMIRDYNEKGEDEPIYIGEELLLPEE